jgi:hypothetical protein
LCRACCCLIPLWHGGTINVMDATIVLLRIVNLAARCISAEDVANVLCAGPVGWLQTYINFSSGESLPYSLE